MIVLKKEKFGGIAFNSSNANQVYLDKELFSNFCLFLEGSFGLNNQIKKIIKELEVKKIDFIMRNNKTISYNSELSILSSPTLADIAITTKCNLHCPHCYMSSSSKGEHMSIDNFRLALQECKKNGVLQIALGGGEPTLHPNFTQILKEIKQAGIVPNLTTNGKVLSWKTVYAMARYSGAVALSIEAIGKNFETRRKFSFSEFVKSITKLKSAGINLVFQITISKENLNSIPQIINYLIQFKPYGLLFLAYKPQGRGISYNTSLSLADSEKIQRTIKYILQKTNITRVGFDCCITPSLMHLKNVNSFEGCSASRSSLAIMTDLTVLPCSFLLQDKHADNLKQKNLADIWQGFYFNRFRDKIRSQKNSSTCNSCNVNNICLGGCPSFNLAKCCLN